MLRCAPVAWRETEYLTAIVKASFHWQDEAEMLLADAEPLVLQDEPHDGNPALSLRYASELVPSRPKVDVLMTATAFGAGGQPVPSAAVRLAVYRASEPLIDKTLHIFGDRRVGDDGNPTGPVPFESLKLRYDRSHRDADNPHGVDGRRLPNNVYPGQPGRSAGFGPLSPFAHSRNCHLGSTKQHGLKAEKLALADDMDWQYFQAAPEDQRLQSLQGNEQVVLDGVHPARPRLRSQLPSARAEAYLGGGTANASAALSEADAAGWVALPLTADTLQIDADRGLVSIVWRGHLRLSATHRLSELILAAGVALPGETLHLRPAAELYAETDSPVSSTAGPLSTGPLSTGPVSTTGPRSTGPLSTGPHNTAPLSRSQGQEPAGDAPSDSFGAGHTVALGGQEPGSSPAQVQAPFALSEAGSSGPRSAPMGAPYGPPLSRVAPELSGDMTMAVSPQTAASAAHAAHDSGGAEQHDAGAMAMHETSAMSADVVASVRSIQAPFPLPEAAGREASVPAPAGAPFSHEPAPDVQLPSGDQTMALRSPLVPVPAPVSRPPSQPTSSVPAHVPAPARVASASVDLQAQSLQAQSQQTQQAQSQQAQSQQAQSQQAQSQQAQSQDPPMGNDEPADAAEPIEEGGLQEATPTGVAEAWDDGALQDSEPDEDLWEDDEVPTPPPRRPTPGVLKGEALVAAMRQANASEEDIAAALLALSPPPPPDEEDDI